MLGAMQQIINAAELFAKHGDFVMAMLGWIIALSFASFSSINRRRL